MYAHILNILETVSQVANEWMVHMLEHSPFSDDVSHAFGSDDCQRGKGEDAGEQDGTNECGMSWMPHEGSGRYDIPSSFRMYFNAKDSPVSFLSTIRTFPNAPRPTTRKRRKWFRFTAHRDGGGQLSPLDFRRRQRAKTGADQGRRQRGEKEEGRGGCGSSPSPSNSTGLPWPFPMVIGERRFGRCWLFS